MVFRDVQSFEMGGKDTSGERREGGECGGSSRRRSSGNTRRTSLALLVLSRSSVGRWQVVCSVWSSKVVKFDSFGPGV